MSPPVSTEQKLPEPEEVEDIDREGHSTFDRSSRKKVGPDEPNVLVLVVHL